MQSLGITPLTAPGVNCEVLSTAYMARLVWPLLASPASPHPMSGSAAGRPVEFPGCALVLGFRTLPLWFFLQGLPSLWGFHPAIPGPFGLVSRPSPELPQGSRPPSLVGVIHMTLSCPVPSSLKAGALSDFHCHSVSVCGTNKWPTQGCQ